MSKSILAFSFSIEITFSFALLAFTFCFKPDLNNGIFNPMVTELNLAWSLGVILKLWLVYPIATWGNALDLAILVSAIADCNFCSQNRFKGCEAGKVSINLGSKFKISSGKIIVESCSKIANCFCNPCCSFWCFIINCWCILTQFCILICSNPLSCPALNLASTAANCLA